MSNEGLHDDCQHNDKSSQFDNPIYGNEGKSSENSASAYERSFDNSLYVTEMASSKNSKPFHIDSNEHTQNSVSSTSGSIPQYSQVNKKPKIPPRSLPRISESTVEPAMYEVPAGEIRKSDVVEPPDNLYDVAKLPSDPIYFVLEKD